ncbi:MAG: alanine--tRNA ligase [Candidatus Liptonbacteria bacterium]|nr:alanine--tRNA ligase [Candidatus Liptonbacteria bacterium]
MSSEGIRKKFLEFFEKNRHAVVPSSSLIPDDPSVLLTTAGMQQFKKYFTGELDFAKDYPGKIGAASCQKSFRTSDIDEVGDERHLTFFEMLGNFSFGGYFKKEAISYAHEFITKEMSLKIEWVSVFEGKDEIGVPRDTESEEIWKSLGVSDVRSQGMDDVFWGPTGSSGPCGPTTEIYCKNGAGQDIEVWNIVFNQYLYPGSREELNAGVPGKKLEPLRIQGVDTGMGLERLAMCMQKTKTIFETDLFAKPFFLAAEGALLESGRILADHLRASVFLLADGVRPGNKGAGYILRRLIRRAIIRSKKVYGSPEAFPKLINKIIDFYGNFYKELNSQHAEILKAFSEEQQRFQKTMDAGLKEFFKKYPEFKAQEYRGEPYKFHIPKNISGEDVFHFHQTYGLTLDIIKDLAEEGSHKVNIDEEGFEKEFQKHQEISRAGQEKKFGGHGLLLDTGELKAANEEELKKVTRLHTATHMLQQALRDVLGPEVKQMGSDITVERTRFDFAFPRKLTAEEIKAVENRVNEKVKEDLPMQKSVLPKSEAEKTGALFFFKEKYPDPVNVYFIGKNLENAWSKEFCGGPHVAHTGEIGIFKIVKEEAVGSGVRRIRGIVEP